MDWKVILFILLLVFGVGYLWFDNIRWTIRFWRSNPLNKGDNKGIHIISGEKVGDCENNDCDNTPKPRSMSNIKYLNCSVDNNYQCYADSKPKSYKNPNLCVFVANTLRHIRIIKRLSTKCKQNHLAYFLVFGDQ